MSSPIQVPMSTVLHQIRKLAGCDAVASLALVTPRIYGIPRGGVFVAALLAASTGGTVVSEPQLANVIVDDIWDSGATAEKYKKYGVPILPLFDKWEPSWAGRWLVMPWEVDEHGADHSTDDIGLRLLQALGEDPNRGGLRETPKRWLEYMREATSGRNADVKALLKVFEDGAENVDEMVVVAGIPFYSMCEHHLAPFFGVAHVAYIPGRFYTNTKGDVGIGARIVGLSKIPRVLDAFAKRLQVQERITNQVADTLSAELGAVGVGVVLRARHLCMEMRGVKKPGSITYTSALRGAMKNKGAARSEFMRFVEMADSRMGSL